jgi:hypothetical protein
VTLITVTIFAAHSAKKHKPIVRKLRQRRRYTTSRFQQPLDSTNGRHRKTPGSRKNLKIQFAISTAELGLEGPVG